MEGVALENKLAQDRKKSHNQPQASRDPLLSEAAYETTTATTVSNVSDEAFNASTVRELPSIRSNRQNI